MPRLGTETPALPRRVMAPWFTGDTSLFGVESYAGGGEGDGDGCAAPRGGNLGGKEGFGLGVGFCRNSSAEPVEVLTRRAGGGRKLSVDNPVVFALNGTGGGTFFERSASSACRSSCSRCRSDWVSEADRGAPNPFSSEAKVGLDNPPPPCLFICLGGGGKDAGSLREANGRDACSA